MEAENRNQFEKSLQGKNQRPKEGIMEKGYLMTCTLFLCVISLATKMDKLHGI